MPYQVAPVFLIRMAGAPFDLLEQLATPQSVAAARHNHLDAELLERELNQVRRHLIAAAKQHLPDLLIFGSGAVRALLRQLEKISSETLDHRNAKAGDRERHMLLYLQRVCAKNDTFSRFGPSGWGKIDNTMPLRLDPEPGVSKRETFLERWTAHAVAAAVNADADLSAKLAVPALEPHAFDILVNDIAEWPPGVARDKWLSILQPIANAPNEFVSSACTKDREAVLDRTRASLQSLGAERHATERFLYAATNPIGEECFRECHFTVSQPLLDSVAAEAEGWIDLWRDTYAFVASRVAGALRQIMNKAGAGDGPMPLLQFMQAAAAAKLPLQGPGLIAPAVIAFQEVKAAMRKQLQSNLALAEYELTGADCEVVRRNFDYPKFDEYTYPSADLQLAAADIAAANRGDCRWILAELHPPPALLHHCMYWACPDKTTLNAAFARSASGKPNFHFGFFAADFTAHTTVRAFDAMPELTNFVAPQRGNPAWRCIPPDQCEVYVDPQTTDVAVRKMDDHEYLGSFARAWVIPLGFHPFQFAFGPHTPRLRCGNVIVQRRTWTLSLDEFPVGKYHGISPQLIAAAEKVRAEKNLPRHVYIRPTEQALRRSGAEGRDKDTKPIYIDLESYLFMEIFYRWLSKAGEIEITEMLPAPDELLWQEADGRRTFELRTLILPQK